MNETKYKYILIITEMRLLLLSLHNWLRKNELFPNF